MYFRQFWTDPRLSFEKKPNLEKLVVGAEYIELIWVPDTFFVNEKTAYFHKATTENQFLRIMNTGEILRSIRYGEMTGNKWENIGSWNVVMCVRLISGGPVPKYVNPDLQLDPGVAIIFEPT